MKKLNWTVDVFLGLVVAALVFFFAYVVAAPISPAPISSARRDTVLITMPGGEGSGVLVSKYVEGHWHTYVWTAAHVILNKGAVETDIKVTDWKQQRSAARIIAYSEKYELALLEISKPDYSMNSVRFYHGAPPDIGTPVFHIGNFYGSKAPDSYSGGFLSSTNWLPHYYQFNCLIYPGSSGGGFFTATGECLGLADKRCEEGIAIALPSQLIETWAKTHDLNYFLP